MVRTMSEAHHSPEDGAHGPGHLCLVLAGLDTDLEDTDDATAST